ncbi:twin-arginine translocation signal domain-containing protein [Roseicyclus persicicus]|uniref:Twin-arginine translocation signal domain-containing protein n=1 Tax=Roseicyclus persicicus TaxID=2650661 RepID=A0A7X6GX63_9RHOB|nr:twin-arginine translocation signal domain-containing protein [Roseibacterium persicicum]NKX43996.1 twin-arginine translocation signal domain-containing protein [Roseibacterium persicicum]
MLSRRQFIKTAAVTTAAASLAEPTEAVTGTPRLPLKAEPRRRTIFARSHVGGQLRLYSDAADQPRALIRQDALDRAFGKGAGQGLLQPDHWRMIDEGWFSGDDLFLPTDPDCSEFAVWQANYHHDCEAHDILADLLGVHLSPWGGRLDRVGLSFAEHPCTPRFATATLVHADCLPHLVREVAERSDWISVHPDPVST